MENIILIEKYFVLFMIYSVAGWCVEEVTCSIIEKKIVDRGFLIGPLCPIYGFGGTGITIFLTKYINSPIAVFCMGVLLCAVLEYFTSYIMEKIFNARWWDYSNDKLNLNGRICVRTLIPFGVFGMLVLYVFNPFLYDIIESISITELQILASSLSTILILDFIISMAVVSGVTSKAKTISMENPKDNTDEITAKVKEELRKTFAGNRLVNAYPEFTAFRARIKKIARETAEKSKEVVKETAKKGKEAIKETAEKSKEVVKETAKRSKEKVERTAQKGKKAIETEKKRIVEKTNERKKQIKSKIQTKNKTNNKKSTPKNK
ncbi:MAG: hypothetical protein IKG56_02210 [Clostridia bacterium]|nr:hypothetical protein [Clostridia bacterium]